MKRLYKICALGILLVLAFSLCGCIFNKGTVNELEGIYALEEYYYKAFSGKEYEFEENYEYFLLVIRNDAKVDVIYKLVGEEEQKSTHSFSIAYNEEDNEVVHRITVQGFPQSQYSESNGELVVNNLVEDITFTFYPKREDLVSNEITFNLQSGSERVKYQFTRVKDRVNDKNIERAKEKSKEIIED